MIKTTMSLLPFLTSVALSTSNILNLQPVLQQFEFQYVDKDIKQVRTFPFVDEKKINIFKNLAGNSYSHEDKKLQFDLEQKEFILYGMGEHYAGRYNIKIGNEFFTIMGRDDEENLGHSKDEGEFHIDCDGKLNSELTYEYKDWKEVARYPSDTKFTFDVDAGQITAEHEGSKTQINLKTTRSKEEYKQAVSEGKELGLCPTYDWKPFNKLYWANNQ